MEQQKGADDSRDRGLVCGAWRRACPLGWAAARFRRAERIDERRSPFLIFFLLANPGFGAPQTSSLKVVSAGGAVPARGPFLRGPLAPTGRLALKTPLVR